MQKNKRNHLALSIVCTMGLWNASCDEPAMVSPDAPEAGSCFVSDSFNYSEAGPYQWAKERVDGVDIFVPKGVNGCDQAPLIGFAMGTFMGEGVYEDYYGHFASWGMMTVVDPDNILNLGGSSLEGHIEAVLADDKYEGRVTKTGLIGHSQGGAAVANIALDQNVRVDALVGLMPAVFQGSGNIDAAGLYIGASADMFGGFTDPVSSYEKTAGPAFLAQLSGEGHIGAVNGGEALSMSTAWFRCHLTDDGNACNLFETSKRGNCGAFPGRWNDCEGKNY